jgi:hypothetical protein
MITELDNILVKQKDMILGYVNEGSYSVAYKGLMLLAELWIACDYHYKGREICGLIMCEKRCFDVVSLYNRFWAAEQEWKTHGSLRNVEAISDVPE